MNKSLIALVLTAVLAGCSSSGGSEPAQPQFDGDYGFENIDPGFGNGEPSFDGDNGYDNADPTYGNPKSIADRIDEADLGFVHIPELGDIPFFNRDDSDAHVSAVREQVSDEHTLYSIYVDDKRVGEIIIRDNYVTVSSGDKMISGEQKSYLDTEHTFWTVKDTNGNVVGDFKRLDDGVWVFREEMNRETFVVKYHDGQWNFIPVADVKNKVKDNLHSQAEVTKVRAKMQVNKLRTLK
ncbi:membrane lipoprotein lipid attachment site-containing protein [Vibrio splendidus]|uniref:membrane lipoprotein lipid attachment site-containing protein n=1 Tax=Vibrio splendidus TaxID=29497 RepID=UPI001E4B226B|nr:membrane lipoprotein lipid attachment site-containing protein [Vibrio splendidus]MCC4787805.1 membrane lipoprotein lipid attachment site-containing protein [Vibrio splendidus]